MNSNLQNLDDLDDFDVVVIVGIVGFDENEVISSSDHIHHHFH